MYVWSSLGKERYRSPGKLTVELVLSQQKQTTLIFMDYVAYQVGREGQCDQIWQNFATLTQY